MCSKSFLSVFRRQLGIAVHFRKTACFDVPPRRLAKEAFVFAVELTRTFVSDVERGAGRIDSLNQHSLARSSCVKIPRTSAMSNFSSNASKGVWSLAATI